MTVAYHTNHLHLTLWGSRCAVNRQFASLHRYFSLSYSLRNFFSITNQVDIQNKCSIFRVLEVNL